MTRAELLRRIRHLERDRALLLEITRNGAALPVVRTSMRRFKQIVRDFGDAETYVDYLKYSGTPATAIAIVRACAKLEKARKGRKA